MSKLPIARILWAPTNAAHHNHLHVEGDPTINGVLKKDCTSRWTNPINAIVAALDEEFGVGDHYQVWDDTLGWTHMGVYNCRPISGTNIPSQHAFSNAIDIGPYYGVEEQQKFYDFLVNYDKEDDMVSRKDKADDGREALKDNFEELVNRGVMSEYTQPGGVAFNDEIATFLLRFEDEILDAVEQLVDQSGTSDAHARSLANKGITLAKSALDKLRNVKDVL